MAFKVSETSKGCSHKGYQSMQKVFTKRLKCRKYPKRIQYEIVKVLKSETKLERSLNPLKCCENVDKKKDPALNLIP